MTRFGTMAAAAAARRGLFGGTTPATAALFVALTGAALAGAVLTGEAFAAERGAPAADSTRVPVADSLARDPTAIRPQGAGVQDTVTVLPPLKVPGVRSVAPGRSSATVVKIERAQVMRFAPSVPSDALVTVPGVDLVKSGPWASRVSLRGLSGDRVLILMDGVRLNTVRGHGAQSSIVPLDRLDEVELLPGASSAAFGSDALGGVINFVTHRSLFESEPRLSLTAASRGAAPGGSWSQSERARFLSPNVGIEASGALGALDYLHAPEGRIANSGDREEDWSARVGARRREAILDYEHVHHAARDVGLPAFNGGPGSAFRAAAGASGVYPIQERDADRLELVAAHLPFLNEARVLGVAQRFGYRFTETTPESVFFRGRFTGLRETIAADRVATHVRSVQPTLALAMPGEARIVGEYRRENSVGPRDFTVTVRDPAGAVRNVSSIKNDAVPPAWRESWAIGATAAEELWTVRLESGLRYETVRSHADASARSGESAREATHHRLSAEGGLTREVGALTSYVHVATGFRAPNLDELYFHDTIHGTLRLFGNRNLEPERSVAYEVGVRTGETWGGRIASARLSTFRSDVDDLISFKYVGAVELVPNFQYFNLDRARIEGVEATLDLRLAGISLAVSAALPRGRDLDTGKHLNDTGVARASVDVVAPMTRVLPQGAAAVRWRWNDAVGDVDPSLARAAFSVVAVEVSAIVADVRGVVAVRNLWNHSYVEPLSFIPEPGRTFALSLRHDFGFSFTRNARE